METKILQDITAHYPKPNANAQIIMESAFDIWNKKIIVLDDDPTGIQTVHDIPVYSVWEQEYLDRIFTEDGLMAFILTNSRSMSCTDAERVNRDIAQRALSASRKTGKEFILISRGDSTLRGYYPLETETLRKTLEKSSEMRFDGEIICPFFLEGGRYTAGNIHYVLTGNRLIPVSDTEFAADRSFGYRNSDLTMWIEEKTCGKYNHEDVLSISIDILRIGDTDAVRDILLSAENFAKVVVNALCYDDIRIFCAGFIKADSLGKRFLFRTAAAIPKILGRVSDRPLLDGRNLKMGNNGGLVIIGSHVMKTTRQLEALYSLGDIEFIEFNQHLVLDNTLFEAEITRVKKLVNKLIPNSRDTVIYTRRERLDIDTGDPQDELFLARRISNAITSFVGDLDVKPSYIIAKGGITASDIGSVGLASKRAVALGQIFPGVPVWRIGPESKFPGMSYIIFPGNVGGDDALKIVVQKLRIERL